MKKLKLSQKFFAACMLVTGASQTPVQAFGLDNTNAKNTAPVTIASAPVSQPIDSFLDQPVNENDLPRINSKTLTINTNRDTNGNLLVADTGTVKYAEQSASVPAAKGSSSSNATIAAAPVVLF